MLILLVGILLILYSVATKKFNIWVAMLFVLMILGFQENIPGDYMSYKYAYRFGGDTGGPFNTIKETEYSYLWLVQTLSKYMNFHWFVLLTSVVQCLAIGLMIRKNSVKRYQYFGVLLVFFTLNILLLQMKAMRQGYAVDMMFLAYFLLGKRKYFLSLIPIVIAYGFHNSIMVAIPFYVIIWVLMFLRRKKEKNEVKIVVANKTKGVMTSAFVTIGLFVFYFIKFAITDRYLAPYLDTLDFFEYSSYMEQFQDTGIALWILLYYAVCVFCVTLYYVNEQNFFRKSLALVSISTIFILVATFGFGNLMRIGMYFIIFSVVVYPNVADMLHNTYGKKWATYFVIFNMLFVMAFSVRSMISYEVTNGYGYATFAFSFLNW